MRIFLGLGLGAIAATIWAGYLVAGRYGILTGMNAFDLALARYVGAGLLCLPLTMYMDIRGWMGLGWRRGLTLVLLAGPLFHLLIIGGLTFTPVRHGGVIGPAFVAITGIVLAHIMLGERLNRIQKLGALMVIGTALAIGADNLASNEASLPANLMFMTGGACWGTFTVLLRRWEVTVPHATYLISFFSMVIYAPLYFIAGGWQRLDVIFSLPFLWQTIIQGVFAGVVALVLFMFAVWILGAARAALIPCLVPVLAMLGGVFLLGEVATLFHWLALTTITLGLVLASYRF